MKLVGLWLMGAGRFAVSLATLVVAYAATFFIVERIYHAGRANLLTIRWVAFVMEAVVRLREAVLDRIPRAAALSGRAAPRAADADQAGALAPAPAPPIRVSAPSARRSRCRRRCRRS